MELSGKTRAGVIAMKPLAGGALRNAGPVLKFIREHQVSTAIPGMDGLLQVDQNARLGDGPLSLTAEEREALEKEAATFCRRCEYCQPCPRGIDIPGIFLLDGYYTRYDLQGWARERYMGMPVKADACQDCGECEEKCPHSLPIRRMLVEAAAGLG